MIFVKIKTLKKEQIRGLIVHLMEQNPPMIQVIETFVVNE
jgi:hypothetical protein